MTIDNSLETSTNHYFSSLIDLDENNFQQWKNSISNEIRAPDGLTIEKRQYLWISLAKKYIHDSHLDWNKTQEFAFNKNSYPEDEQLNNQIIKDLHRTGCNWSSNESNRTILHCVLLAFARYNKSIGYCQGLHILTSVILDVVNMNEEHALMILIYLVDGLLPNFFENNLHGLALDITVFDRWLQIYNPQLHHHLHKLQALASQNNSEITYEPPLLNIFTIQWFLTLFATCLPRKVTLRIWDVLMIEGNEVLFRTGLLLWSKLSIAILKVPTADQFYSAMNHLSVQLLDENIILPDKLIQEIYHFGRFPMDILSELRQKYSYQQLAEDTKLNQTNGQINSHELKSKVVAIHDNDIKSSRIKLIDDDIANFISCFAILSTASRTNQFESFSNNKTNLSDINQLRQQYKQLKHRNKQEQIILQSSNQQRQHSSESVCSISNGPLINHLLVKPMKIKHNQYKTNVSTKSTTINETQNIHKQLEQLVTCSDKYIERVLTTQSSQIPKYSSFNPFPSRSFNENVAVNGYKLGLYSPSLTTR